MTKSTGVGRGGRRAGAFGRDADAPKIGDVHVNAYLSEDDIDYVRELGEGNLSAGIRKAILLSRSPRLIDLKSIAKRPAFIALVASGYFPDGRKRNISSAMQEEMRVNAVNAQRRKLYDAGAPYKHLI